MRLLSTALFLLAVASPARAERPFRLETAPPVARAIDLAFGATTWTQVQVSTSGAVVDLTRLVRAGFYKRELIELVLMSARSHRALKEAVEKRRQGAKLSEIAFDWQLDWGEIEESALAIEAIVDRDYLPRFPEKRPRREREEP